MQVDLHIHTKYSFDCNMEPKKVIKVAQARGLNAIAITDHNSIEGALEARKYSNGDFPVIVGEEIYTKAGDVIGLFLKEVVLEDDPLEAIAHIKEQDGVAILPHPFTRHLSLEERVARRLDGCEGFNARHSRVKTLDNPEGEAEVVEFARQYDLTLVASSDAHFYHEIGRARTILPASNLDEVKEALLRGNTALQGRRSGALNLFMSVTLRTFRRMINPVPETYVTSKSAKPTRAK